MPILEKSEIKMVMIGFIRQELKKPADFYWPEADNFGGYKVFPSGKVVPLP